MGVTVETRGDKLRATIADVKELEQSVTIGVHGDAAPYPDGTDVVQAAAAHEFGTDTIPPRPFLRGYYDSGGAKQMGDEAREMIGKVIDDTASPGAIGDVVGTMAVQEIRKFIEAGIDPPLAASTRANPERDSAGTPLLDTRHLASQITRKVEPG